MTRYQTFLTTAEEVAQRLECLMEAFPELASDQTKAAVDNWRRQAVTLTLPVPDASAEGDLVGDTRERLSGSGPQDQIAREAIELVAIHSIKDAMDLLIERFGVTLDYAQLIDLIGIDHYRQVLRREAVELQQNKVSLLQTSELWNSMGRPAMGDALWGPKGVSMLLEHTALF